MRALYLFLVIFGLTRALPVENYSNIEFGSIKKALSELNENNINETLNKLYVDYFRDSVKKFDVEHVKEHDILNYNNQNFGPLETIIVQVLERLRGILVNGTDTIPVLDPITIDKIHIGDSILTPPSYISVNNLTIKDVSTFEIEQLKLSPMLLRQRLDFNIVIPAILVNTSSYDISLNFFGGLIFGKGDMQLTINKPRVHGRIILSVRITANGLSLSINECRIHFSLASFEPVITGMFNDQTVSDFVAAFLRNLVPEMLDYFEEDITNILSRITQFVGNLILSDLNLGNLLPSS